MASLHVASELVKAIGNVMYPVGSIYLTTNGTNPGTFLGGTWTKMTGGFLYGVVNSISNGNGTGTSTNNHILTVNEIPSHDHGGSVGTAWSNFMRVVGVSGTSIAVNHMTGHASGSYVDSNGGNIPGANHQHNISKQGGGSGHNHAIPYLGVWVWKRTA